MTDGKDLREEMNSLKEEVQNLKRQLQDMSPSESTNINVKEMNVKCLRIKI